MELTNGKGVDIVLNSLAGPLLDASYECIAGHGRLVELGMTDLTGNKQLGMADIRRDVSLIIVDVYLCLMECHDFAIGFFDWMHQNCRNGCIKPVQQIVFNAKEVNKAFRFMTTGKHIGKIVIRIRDEKNDENLMKPLPAPKLTVSTHTYFNPNKVYIITGGLGGFALELIHWMISKCAKKFVLTSRSGLKNDYQKFIVNRLICCGEQNNYFKVDIKISQNDCLTIGSTRRVITQALELGEIGGLFHSTLILNDSLLEVLEFDKFCETIDAKHKVLNNLDLELRKLSYNLDLFVVFSSIMCGKGNAGQTNYGMANALCERICEQRRRDGLHGLAIQFGPVGDVGAITKLRESIKLFDYQDQSIKSCLDVLGKYLSVENPIVTSYVCILLKLINLDTIICLSLRYN